MKTHPVIRGLLAQVVTLGLLLALGPSLAAQVVPAWSSDFSQHKDGELLADAKSYRSRDAKWRLHSGNNEEMPAGTKAVLKKEGALSFAQVTAEGNRNSLNARIVARGLETINLSQGTTVLGGDIRYIGAGTSHNTHANAAIMFTGRAENGDLIQIIMGISHSAQDGYRFYSNFNDLTNRALSQALSSQEGAPKAPAIDPNKWYSFIIEIAAGGVATVKVFDGSELVWSATSDGKFAPASINSVEMQVIRSGSRGYRTADFANIGIGKAG